MTEAEIGLQLHVAGLDDDLFAGLKKSDGISPPASAADFRSGPYRTLALLKCTPVNFLDETALACSFQRAAYSSCCFLDTKGPIEAW